MLGHRFTAPGVAAAALLLLTATAPPASADTSVRAQLTPVNGTAAAGSVTLTATGDRLTVEVEATGLVPGQPHAQHIHGSPAGGHAACPSPAQDEDGDGAITNEEATGEYGDITMTLSTEGGTDAAAGLELDRMPVADAQGRLSYTRTFRAALVPDGLTDQLERLHVVIHGVDANGNDRYDLKGLGESTFARNLGLSGVPEEATNPAACGVVTGAGAHVVPEGGIETGGAPPLQGDGPRAPLGVALLAASAGLLVTISARWVAAHRRAGADR